MKFVEHKKLVSIVLPTYNGSKYISQSIESCLNQSYQNIELIIVNDASTDSTRKIIFSCADPRIIYAENHLNVGLANSLNNGFAKSNGSYLTWTSDDNYYAPNAIETMVNVLENKKGVDFVYANYYRLYEKENKKELFKVRPPKDLNIDNYIGSCFLYRRKVYNKIGDYNPETFLVEDYEYWLRVRKYFRMKKIDKGLYYHRYHSKSLTSTFRVDEVQKKVRELRDRYNPRAFRYYLHGRKYFYNNKLTDSKKLLFKSVALNPLNYQAWRLLALIYINPAIVSKIRKIKYIVYK